MKCKNNVFLVPKDLISRAMLDFNNKCLAFFVRKDGFK